MITTLTIMSVVLWRMWLCRLSGCGSVPLLSIRILPALTCSLLVTSHLSTPAAEPRRVLIVHSFGSAAPPFTTHSIAFETELTEKLGQSVDLDEVSLDMARYADTDMQEALVDYLQKRQAKWQPDLVVPIGSPAGIFVAQYRDRMFPQATIIYCGMDGRRLPPGALENNATFVGEDFDLPGFVKDILQIAPATTNIAVVIGASQLEQFWKAALQESFEPFTNRVSFSWLDDLSFDQLLEHVSKLPPHSHIFLVLLMRDATGVTHNADEALRKISAVANAPVSGIFQHQLGMGIVGGHLYQAEQEGIEAARIAIHILRGEPVSNYPPKIIAPLNPRYDWRQLQRWKISEESLPPGSTVMFRVPTMWDRYRRWFVAGISVCLIEAVLISVLLANLVRRRRAERSLEESENRFRMVADAAPVMIWMSGLGKQSTFFNKPWLEFTGRTLEQELGDGWAENVHPDDVQSCLRTYTESFDLRQPFVMEYRLRQRDGEYRWISDSGRPRYDNQGTFSGYIGICLDVTDPRHNTDALVASENRLRSILDTAVEGIITIDNRGVIESANAAAENIFGYKAAELIGQNVSVLMPASRRQDREQYTFDFPRTNSPLLFEADGEVKGRRKDGSFFPMDLAMSRVELPDRQIFTGFLRDITERKQAEQTAREFGGRLLQAQENERARLARELHDDITQRLARLSIDAGSASQPEAMRNVRDGLASLSEDIHALSYRLHPSMLADLGLAAALKTECERFAQQTSIRTEVKISQLPATIPHDVALSLFRIAQEALRNIFRHANSLVAEVSLRPLEDGLQLAVIDQGTGFDLREQRRPSLGLASMRERVRLLGGEVVIESEPGRGTTILAWVPLKDKSV